MNVVEITDRTGYTVATRFLILYFFALPFGTFFVILIFKTRSISPVAEDEQRNKRIEKRTPKNPQHTLKALSQAKTCAKAFVHPREKNRMKNPEKNKSKTLKKARK